MHGKSKVLVTGSAGMLGTNLLRMLSFKDIVGFSSSELDVSNVSEVLEVLSRENPDIIIHTAAFTNVELCEDELDKAYSINAMGTQNLVNYCINKDILFVYISSTGIYGQEKRNRHYNEFDRVNPTTVHHKTKHAGEKIVSNHLNKYLIIRTGWLFGGDKEHQKNFVYKRYLEAKNATVIQSDTSQIGNPTSILNLIEQIEVLIKREQYGIFNCVNNADNVSRYDYVNKIVELFELGCHVKPVNRNSFKRKAAVSPNESAINYKLDLLNLNVMKSWDESLEEYIKYLRKEI